MAPLPSRYRDRFASCCQPCFRGGLPCPHFQDTPLRLLIVGHNPSDHAWSTGHFYSNPTNHFWSLMAGTYGALGPKRDGAAPAVAPGVAAAAAAAAVPRGVVPPTFAMEDMNTLPSVHGIGICDVLTAPGSVASEYSPAVMVKARGDLYARLRGHMARARANAAAAGCGDVDCAPCVVAISGKRHWSMLFEPPLKRVDHFGLQPAGQRPPGWPLPPSCEVWVMTSTSGRAAMTKEEREAPWVALAARVHAVPWPRVATPGVPASSSARASVV